MQCDHAFLACKMDWLPDMPYKIYDTELNLTRIPVPKKIKKVLMKPEKVLKSKNYQHSIAVWISKILA